MTVQSCLGNWISFLSLSWSDWNSHAVFTIFPLKKNHEINWEQFITSPKIHLFTKAHKNHAGWGKVPSPTDVSPPIDFSRRQHSWSWAEALCFPLACTLLVHAQWNKLLNWSQQDDSSQTRWARTVGCFCYPPIWVAWSASSSHWAYPPHKFSCLQ